MSPTKRKLVKAPDLSSRRARPAQLLRPLDSQDEDRAIILGQLAELLAAHRRIGKLIAFKGGAIMHLVDGSARLSRDLDGAIATGRAIQRVWVEEALSTAAAKRVVTRLPRIVNENPKSLVFPQVLCHSLNRKGHATVGVSFSINWDDPLVESSVRESIALPTGRVQIPVLSRAERASEKARTFLTRGEARDAYDLHHYGAKTLDDADWKRQPRIIKRKLMRISLPTDVSLHQQWDAQTALAREAYERNEGLVLRAPKPDWDEVAVQLRRFKACIPEDMPTTRATRAGGGTR